MTDHLTLREALSIVGARTATRSRPYRLGLACGFTPLHLVPLLQAYTMRRLPDREISIVTGTYGDLARVLDELAAETVDGCAVVVEWADLDPRLSPRLVGRTRASDDDIVETARTSLNRLRPRLAAIAAAAPLVVVGPSLPLPPAYVAAPGRLSALAATLRAALADFCAALSGVAVVDLPATPDAWDLRQHLRADFPYTVEHASVLAERCVAALVPTAPKKGLITDLDDTLWRGLVGEIGADAVSWDLDSNAQTHAIYQQLLEILGADGTLLGVASKNDPDVVAAALARPDLVLDPERLFPVIASWQPKSVAVGEILRAWNIGASDVVVVDDSPLELAEIAAAHPRITTIRFPSGDPNGVRALLGELNALFRRDHVSADDRTRVASLRAGAAFEQDRAEVGDETGFLRSLEARITVQFGGAAFDRTRAYELVNKTNQFNLNGRRYEPAEWRRMGERAGALGAVVSYADRFGDLGVIGVLAGTVEGRRLVVDAWVLSCRAFSRAIEVHLLVALADHLDVDEIALDHRRTERNHLVGDLLAALGAEANTPNPVLSADTLRSVEHGRLHQVVLVQSDGAKQ